MNVRRIPRDYARAGSIAALIAAGVAVCIALVWMEQHPGRLGGGIACNQAYHEARSAADTTMVDLRTGLSAGRRAERLTCGELRRRAQLPR